MTSLNLEGTQISNISPLANLIYLERLYLAHNKLIYSLKSVVPLIERGLEVKDDCPITEPLQEVIKQGNAAILSYFKQMG